MSKNIHGRNIINYTIDGSALDPSANLFLDSIHYGNNYTPLVETEGLTWWNASDNTLNVATGIGDTVIQVGQEFLYKVYNPLGTTIVNGAVVHAIGIFTPAGYPLIIEAQANKWINCAGTLGVVTGDIPPGNIGLATRLGNVRSVDTTDTSAGLVFLSADIPGAITSEKPLFPNFAIEIGGTSVVDASNGLIIVAIAGTIEDTFNNFWNGTFREPFYFDVSSNGSQFWGTLTPQNGHDNMTLIFSDGFSDLNPIDPSINLTAGTDVNPQSNYIYVTKANKILEVSTSDWPVTKEHIKVAEILLQSPSEGVVDGALRNQNWNDPLENILNQGHLSHITEKLRQFEAQWSSGAQGSGFIDQSTTPDGVYVSNTSGVIYQLHRQTFPAFDTSTGDHVHVSNHPTTPYLKTDNLNVLTSDTQAQTLNNTAFSFVMWGVVNSRGEDQLMINLPSDSYPHASPDSAVNDALNYSVYEIPSVFQGVGFLIARFTYTYKNDEWVLYDTEDLRGRIPNSTAGGGGGGIGVTTFPALSDTPSSYIGTGKNLVQVNLTESALEFTNTIDISTLISTVNIGIGGTTNPSETLDVSGNTIFNGGNIRDIRTEASDYIIALSDYTILADATSNTVDITLPTSPNQGQMYYIKCINATFTCTVIRNGNNIDGSASNKTLILNESITIQFDSTFGWAII